MLANISVVILGDRIGVKLPIKAIRITAAIVSTVLGVITITGFG
jgi:putative Ca2+/H+ antiporter (TMEM165/GDT1 family)